MEVSSRGAYGRYSSFGLCHHQWHMAQRSVTLGTVKDKSLTSYTDYITIHTPTRYETRDITDDVERVRAAAKLQEGFVLVSTMHITSSIFVNDHESGLYADIMKWLEELAPFGVIVSREPQVRSRTTATAFKD